MLSCTSMRTAPDDEVIKLMQRTTIPRLDWNAASVDDVAGFLQDAFLNYRISPSDNLVFELAPSARGRHVAATHVDTQQLVDAGMCDTTSLLDAVKKMCLEAGLVFTIKGRRIVFEAAQGQCQAGRGD